MIDLEATWDLYTMATTENADSGKAAAEIMNRVPGLLAEVERLKTLTVKLSNAGAQNVFGAVDLAQKVTRLEAENEKLREVLVDTRVIANKMLGRVMTDMPLDYDCSGCAFCSEMPTYSKTEDGVVHHKADCEGIKLLAKVNQ